MQTFDNTDILGMMWLAAWFGGILVIAFIASLIQRRGERPILPNPDPKAVVGHKRYYRVTTSRINDRGGI